jgi:hypothetical protein
MKRAKKKSLINPNQPNLREEKRKPYMETQKKTPQIQNKAKIQITQIPHEKRLCL